MMIRSAVMFGAIAAAFLAGEAVAQQAAPSNETVEAAIRAGFDTYLKDPSGAQLKIDRAPVWGTVNQKGGTAFTGWLVCGQVNGKNSYGAYVGYERYLFIVDPAGGAAKILPQFTRQFENADAYRAACILDPPQVG